MNHEFALTIVTSLITGPGVWGIFQIVLSRKQKEREDRHNKLAEDSQTWYRESRHHYEVAKEEAAEAKQECADCIKELRATRQVIYRLLEDLEDQILPMLMMPELNSADIRVAMRVTIKTAREAL
jgi:acetyl-CoA carboxylase carboxyltransferase component